MMSLKSCDLNHSRLFTEEYLTQARVVFEIFTLEHTKILSFSV